MYNFSIEEEKIMDNILEIESKDRCYSLEDLQIIESISNIEECEDKYTCKYLDDIIKSIEKYFVNIDLVFEYLDNNFNDPLSWFENILYLAEYGLTKEIKEEIDKVPCKTA